MLPPKHSPPIQKKRKEESQLSLRCSHQTSPCLSPNPPHSLSPPPPPHPTCLVCVCVCVCVSVCLSVCLCLCLPVPVFVLSSGRKIGWTLNTKNHPSGRKPPRRRPAGGPQRQPAVPLPLPLPLEAAPAPGSGRGQGRAARDLRVRVSRGEDAG